MRYNAFFKFVAVILAVAALVAVLGSAMAVVFCVDSGLYTRDPDEIRYERLDHFAYEYAHFLAEGYAFRQSNLPAQIWREQFWYNTGINSEFWLEADYLLMDQQTGETVDTTSGEYAEKIGVEIGLRTGSVVKIGENWTYYGEQPQTATPPADDATMPIYDPGEQNTVPVETTMPVEKPEPTVVTEEASFGENTEPVMVTDATMPPEVIRDEVGTTAMDENERWYEVVSTSDGSIYRLYRNENVSMYTVVVCFTQEQAEEIAGSRATGALGDFLYEERYNAITVLVVSLTVLILMLVYLACAAGHKPGTDEIRPGGLNRLPLDLYAAADCGMGFGLLLLLFDGVAEELFDLERLWGEYFWVLILAGAGLCAGIGLICVLFWMALCAQLKAGDGFWWKNSLIGRVGRQVWRLIVHVLRRIVAMLTGVGGKAGGKVLSIGQMLRDVNNKLPLMWQWLAMSLVMFLLLAIFGFNVWNEVGLVMYLVTAAMCVALIIYGARAFGSLRQAAKQMSQGNLDVKIDPERLDGCFKDFAYDLNALSDACILAAREQMKSERMRTELITNVSHDIKTPLTSIINYVDLLQKAESEEQRKEYLEVLERQSARLKKLIEDLMEMSKASSGNVAVELAATDVAEAVNQALGEYADRFDALRLNVVLRKPREQVLAMCDGKLLWRVMSNVMSNIVKYAMPGTRVYLDLTADGRKVCLAMKNISRDELNITAEELMERFVRGDESRNTEGNGLGLNIARSLMEVQGGSLDLVVDGDLFKVVLALPAAAGQLEEPAE